MAARFPRRAFLLAGAGAAAIGWTELVWPRIADVVRPKPEFEPIQGLDGYRKLVKAGSMSGALAHPFVGLAPPDDPASAQLPEPRLPANPCDALYGHRDPDRVQLAVFTDFNCPYCKTLDARVLKRVENRPRELTISIHQLPLLGHSSLWGARGALAAGQQDAYMPFHKRLMSAAFAITPDYLVTVAKTLGLDEEKLMQDATGQKVADQIAASRAFAARLGVFGTPGLLVGRSLVLGQVAEGTLTRLIDMEAAEMAPPNCTAFG